MGKAVMGYFDIGVVAGKGFVVEWGSFFVQDDGLRNRLGFERLRYKVSVEIGGLLYWRRRFVLEVVVVLGYSVMDYLNFFLY